MTGAEERTTPQHDLNEVQARVEEDGFQASKRVLKRQIGRFGDRDDVVELLLSLADDDFYKSQLRRHGDGEVWMDIYKPRWDGTDWYVKFFLGTNDRVVVWSFKWDGAI